MKRDNSLLPMYDAQGKPVRLKPTITYTMRVKNGYILALRPNQHQVRLPNLLTAKQPRRGLFARR